MKSRLPALLASASFLAASSAGAAISVFDFQGPWSSNKEANFNVFAANAPSTDTDVNSSTSLLSNSGYTGGGYASFYIRDIDGGTVGVADGGDFIIFSTSDTPGVGMNVGGANATVPTNYFAFTVTPDAGYQTTFESLSFYTDVNGANDTYTIELRAWDGSTESTLGAVSHTTGGSANEPVVFKSIDFTDFASTAATEFRIYGYGVSEPSSNPANGGIRFDDITLHGVTVAIPEPHALALLGLTGMALLRRRKR